MVFFNLYNTNVAIKIIFNLLLGGPRSPLNCLTSALRPNVYITYSTVKIDDSTYYLNARVVCGVQSLPCWYSHHLTLLSYSVFHL